jgi:anti-sigma regulatory factor (Ser/Thr protein kinase)
MTQFAANALATPEAISGLTDTLLTFLKDQNVDARTTHHVALIVEEVLTNVGTHGNCRDTPARITVTVEPTQVRGEIVDSGEPFDPREAADPDLDLAPDERPVGGLGLFLVRQLACNLEYERRKEENWTTFAVART